MKYINTTSIPIYIQINGNTHLINPGQEIMSDLCLLEFGLTAFPEEIISTPNPKKTTKSKTTKTNEFSNTNKTKN